MTGVVAKKAGVITASAVRTVAVIMIGISSMIKNRIADAAGATSTVRRIYRIITSVNQRFSSSY